jgi:outer membrane protein TolC
MYCEFVRFVPVGSIVSVDLEIQVNRVLRIILVMTTWAGATHFSGADLAAQVRSARYPLERSIVPTEAPRLEPASKSSPPKNEIKASVAAMHQTTQPAVQRVIDEPTQQPNLTSKLSSSLDATRERFAKQFEQAYTAVAGSLNTRPHALSNAKNSGDLSTNSQDANSRSDQIAEQNQQSQQVTRIASAYPTVTQLPDLNQTTVSQPNVVQTQFNRGVTKPTNGYPLATIEPSNPNNNTSSDTPESLTWWNQLVGQPLHPENQVQSIDSNGLVYMALQNSPRIQGLSRDPLIRDFEVIEAESAFDPISFLQTQFADRSDPIGGALDATRDGLSTIENHRWTAEGGVRKRARTGATYELSQRLGFENSNVSVFDPNNQGTAQLALNVTQPLARGRGRYITQSQILIAQSRGGVAWESFAADLQEEIEDVVTAYWRLYYDRSVFLQKKRNVERAVEILETLEGRSELDSLPSQITRARSSVQTRKTELANAFRDVRNSETELRRLIADRNWRANQFIELLPVEPPLNNALDISLDHVVTTSLENRPEIRASLQEAKLAGIERDISVNDLLPELSLLLGTYVSTLVDDGRVGEAFVDQFGETKPGYSVGLEFELPVGNRLARSRLVQRKLQLARIRNQVDETIQNVIAESQTALRRIDSAAQTFDAANQAIEAARSDLEQNIRRWENFALVEGDFSDGQTPTTVLDQLLDSQERLSSSETIAAQSQLELKLAEVALQRAMGTLLIQRNINPRRAFEAGTPQIRF